MQRLPCTWRTVRASRTKSPSRAGSCAGVGPPARNARISACAVGSWSLIGRFHPSPITSSPSTSSAPTGTSPPSAARCANCERAMHEINVAGRVQACAPTAFAKITVITARNKRGGAVAQGIMDADASNPADPTLRPLKVRNPMADIENTPITRPRMSARRVQLHQRLRHRIEAQFHESRNEQQRNGHCVGTSNEQIRTARSTRSSPARMRCAASAAAIRGFPR